MHSHKFEHRKKSDCKYTLEAIKPTSKRFHELLKIFKRSSNLKYGSLYQSEFVHIYKVNEINSEEKVEDHKDNLMLYHGTSGKSAIEILEKGFKNSTKENGFFGAGLYMTEFSDIAMNYSYRPFWGKAPSEKALYVFLNEVLNSKQMQTVSFTEYCPHTNPYRYPFARYAHINSPTPTENDYWHDEKGRRYRVAPICPDSVFDEYVADASFVKPRFLFLLKAKRRSLS